MRKNIKKHLYAVILAGGSGTRFWPLSRQRMPKQFLKMGGQRSLLQQAIERIQPLVAGPRCYIVTNARYRRQVRTQTARYKIPAGNILLEPSAKNTAPSVAWAAGRIFQKDRQAVMIVLPSDHLIRREKRFLSKITAGVDLALADYLVTLGIVPTRPETGYGYLQTAPLVRKGRRVLAVQRFTEKPSLPKAKQYFRRKDYFWNSGMFIWKCETILEAFRRYLPRVHTALARPGSIKEATKAWPRLPAISIDYGILEKARNVVAVPAGDIGWSDLGSWASLGDVLEKDRRGNVLQGDVLAVAGDDNVIFADKRLVATIGLKNMVVVDTPDALLVCRKELSQQVKDLVGLLNRGRRNDRA